MEHMINNAKWVESPWLGFDTETTGVSPVRDRLVTAAGVFRPGGLRSKGDSVVVEDAVKVWLADPGVSIPQSASAIHGITTEHAQKHGAPIADVLEEVNATLARHLSAGNVVVIFNAGFDLPLLEAESIRHNVAPLKERLGSESYPIIDPLVLDRASEKFRRGKRTLADLARAYDVEVPTDTHQAHVDSALALDLLAAMLLKHDSLRSLDAKQVHDFQRSEHATWAKDFEQYLKSKGRDTRISQRWF